MIDPDEALRLVIEAAGSPRTQRVPLEDACGLCLAEDVSADRDYPPFSRAMMDGYAVVVADAGARVHVVGEVAAGQSPVVAVGPGECVRIMTGAACPPGSEAVVPQELTRRDGDWVTLPSHIDAGKNIALPASECRAGSRVLRGGETVTPLAVAVMAAFGLPAVSVLRWPALAILVTGSELAAPGQPPQPGQIRDGNGPMLAAMTRQMGLRMPPVRHAGDRLDALLVALQETADCDIVVLSGGVSVGDYDLVPAALGRHGATVVFHQVAQKPGKPLLLARKKEQLFFGLPGNPLACHLGFHRYVAAAIRQRAGRPPAPCTAQGELAEAIGSRGTRTRFLLGRAEAVGHTLDAAASGWRVYPLPGVSSADVFTPAAANCYLRIPPGEVRLPVGEVVPFEWIGRE
jgi:molybdopterin molybdotransferase